MTMSPPTVMPTAIGIARPSFSSEGALVVSGSAVGLGEKGSPAGPDESAGGAGIEDAVMSVALQLDGSDSGAVDTVESLVEVLVARVEVVRVVDFVELVEEEVDVLLLTPAVLKIEYSA